MSVSSILKEGLEEIERQIEEIRDFDSPDKEQVYHAKYLVVFLCGTYEELIENMIVDWVTQTYSQQITAYITNTLDLRFRNPDFQKVVEVLRKFSEDWGVKINTVSKASISGLDSIIAYKNGLAHKGSVELTLPQVIELYTRSKTIMEKIAEILESTQLGKSNVLPEETKNVFEEI